ncbi:MAG: cytochrome P450 [Acidimicrobiales bacterium]
MQPTKITLKPPGQGNLSTLLADVARPDPQLLYSDLAARGWEMVGEGVALCTSKDLSELVLRSPGDFSSAAPLHLGNVRPLLPLNVDPPAHSRYRKALEPIFSARRVAAFEPRIVSRFEGVVDALVSTGGCDFTEDVAEVYPSAVFADLLGLADSDLTTLMAIRDGILHPARLDASAATDIAKLREVQDRSASQLYDYFAGLLEERRDGSLRNGDVMSHLAGWQVNGERLSDEEILDTAFTLVIAGLDTVSDSLTCVFAYLATHPEHRDRIVGDPGVIPAAVDELLRWESPVPTASPRLAVRDVTLPGGIPVSAGTVVLVSLAAANVDRAACPDALEVRLDRRPNRHVAFGAGAHRCIGSHLARLEIAVAVREWQRRIPVWHLARGYEQLSYSAGLRRVDHLRLSWDTKVADACPC